MFNVLISLMLKLVTSCCLIYKLHHHILLMIFYTEVSCVFMESCILPCSFQTDPVIIWFLETQGQLNVHSYYSNQDQLGHQNQFFRGRTSLFKDQISRGNASLQLTGVEVQDQGRYKCHTSTNRGSQDSLINLRVDAPVSKVNMEQVENRIICSSEGIYPEPDLTWSTRPPSNLNLQNQTSIQQTEQQLYNISSSLILSDSETDLSYICTISTRSNSRRAALFKPSKCFKKSWANPNSQTMGSPVWFHLHRTEREKPDQTRMKFVSEALHYTAGTHWFVSEKLNI
uniref:Ig-like domain-containing protein n=1 Tax=Lates calcarifer TaxID=8187 RepID=A0A4W6G2R9_LATCA